MWANAQHDGRTAEHRWRPLFNAAKFGWCPLLECRAVTLPRRETRWNLQGCPKLTNRSQPLVGRSSPYCEDTWGRYCCLTSFFPIVDTCLSCEDIARQSCSKFRTRATPCVDVWQTSNLQWLRLGEEKKERKKKKKKETTGQKYNGLPYYIGRP